MKVIRGGKSQTPTYEFWCRMPYKELVRRKELLAVVRPGDRRRPRAKGSAEGEIALVRILLVPGSEKEKRDPIFDPLQRKVRIEKMIVKRIRALHPRDLAGCSPDSKNARDVRYHLGLIYNRAFTPRETVTVFHFTYL